ncbi:hypothetical protein LEP1GSC060_1674 [Leptospira weilii serovar Ranarum str. ICFT]|uniref:Uncharacterized protein n=1 Tax=Leptospira weilii serovar Ranarum str. ICFT TaxID=1218598 RepID=N1WG82_9LEPT|nr:hypothetical protein LEP1GSC060_1674 [Leptospira weilii serovar Ranarum str. ICFT]
METLNDTVGIETVIRCPSSLKRIRFFGFVPYFGKKEHHKIIMSLSQNLKQSQRFAAIPIKSDGWRTNSIRFLRFVGRF